MSKSIEYLSKTRVKLALSTDKELLETIKHAVIEAIAKKGKIKVAGFREGKVPKELVEKHVDQNQLQQEVLQVAVNRLYEEALDVNHLRPVQQPEITIVKFVPFTELEATAEVEVVGEITLPDYKKIKVRKPEVTIDESEVTDVLENLRVRAAEKKEVKRAAKDTDEVWIDFKGVDDKGESVAGADGTDYPLVLGSNTFIPGFEPELVGLKASEEKTFTVTFPADYGVKALQKKKVTFTVTVKKVQEVVKPKLDDEFAKTVAPVESLDALKKDIRSYVESEKQRQADLDHQSEIMKKIAEKTKAEVPQMMIDEQTDRMIEELKRNITYRGQTYKEYLESEGLSEEEHRKQLAPEAKDRLIAGLALSEIADKEDIQLTKEEMEARLAQVRTQYTDPNMQAELDKPDARREIASQLMTEKTLQHLQTLVES